MKIGRVLMVIVLGLVVVVGCNQKETPAPVAQAGQGASTSPNLGPGGENAMDGMNQLILGTFRLEGTPDAVTPDQARTLLPLWQLIQGGKLQSTDETSAVVKQIEGNMTAEQLAAIEAMHLTNDNVRAWMEEQGIAFSQGDAPGGPGGPGTFQNLSEEERAQMRDEFQNLSPEARATRMAEMGLQPPGGGQGGQGFDPNMMATRGAPGSAGRPGGNGLIQPLVDLLTERAAQ